MFKRKAGRFIMNLFIGVVIPFGAMIMHIKTSFIISLILSITKE